jgi:CRP-like cAMP-binding protein
MATPGIFEGVSPDDIEKLKRALKLRVRVMKDGEILVDEGERTDVFWLLASGGLQGARCYSDGGVDLVQLYAPGDAVCLDVVFTRTRKSLLQISCVKFAEVIAVDRDILLGASVRGVVREIITGNILRILADDSMRKQYKIDVLYKKSLRARVRTFLIHMAEKTDSSSFDIGMDREQFARFLGVNRSALSHELSLMRLDGLILFSKSRFELLPGIYTVQNNDEVREKWAREIKTLRTKL